MRLEQLQYIVEIADTESFSISSERLYISQPSISQAVSALEKELNVPIFYRTKKGVVPTEIGNIIINHARVILNEINEIQKLSIMNNEEIAITIKLGIIPTFNKLILPNVIIKFHEKYPHATIESSESGTQDIKLQIKNGLIDLGLVSQHNTDILETNLYYFKPLIYGKLVCYVSSKSPLAINNKLSFSDLVKYQVLLLNEEYSLRSYLLNNLTKWGTPNILSSVNNPESAKKIVMQSNAIGFGPNISLIDDINVLNGDLVLIDIQNTPDIAFGILINKKRPINIVCEELIKLIVLEANHFNKTHT